MSISQTDPEFFNKHVTANRVELEKRMLAGCYHCLKIFKPSEIVEWIKDINGDTAMCPYCTIDTVYGDASGTPVDIEHLSKFQ